MRQVFILNFIWIIAFPASVIKIIIWCGAFFYYILKETEKLHQKKKKGKKKEKKEKDKFHKEPQHIV